MNSRSSTCRGLSVLVKIDVPHQTIGLKPHMKISMWTYLIIPILCETSHDTRLNILPRQSFFWIISGSTFRILDLRIWDSFSSMRRIPYSFISMRRTHNADIPQGISLSIYAPLGWFLIYIPVSRSSFIMILDVDCSPLCLRNWSLTCSTRLIPTRPLSP